MIKAFALVVMICAASLFVACGDDDATTDEPTPTISATSTDTPARTGATTCSAGEVEATYESSEGAAGHQFVTFTLSAVGDGCTLASPPSLAWYDAAGDALDIPFKSNVGCEFGNNTDYAICNYDLPTELPPAGDRSPGAIYGVQVVISISNIEVLEPCTSPSVQAHIVEFELPDAGGGVSADLPQDVELQSCSPQVTLWGFGPIAAGESATSDIDVSWDEFVDLLESCDVMMVGQTHALSVGLTLDDGRSFASTEPEIDDVFDVVNGLEPDCRPGQLVTE